MGMSWSCSARASEDSQKSKTRATGIRPIEQFLPAPMTTPPNQRLAQHRALTEDVLHRFQVRGIGMSQLPADFKMAGLAVDRSSGLAWMEGFRSQAASNLRALWKTSSIIFSVSLPVLVFCSDGW